MIAFGVSLFGLSIPALAFGVSHYMPHGLKNLVIPWFLHRLGCRFKFIAVISLLYAPSGFYADYEGKR